MSVELKVFITNGKNEMQLIAIEKGNNEIAILLSNITPDGCKVFDPEVRDIPEDIMEAMRELPSLDYMIKEGHDVNKLFSAALMQLVDKINNGTLASLNDIKTFIRKVTNIKPLEVHDPSSESDVTDIMVISKNMKLNGKVVKLNFTIDCVRKILLNVSSSDMEVLKELDDVPIDSIIRSAFPIPVIGAQLHELIGYSLDIFNKDEIVPEHCYYCVNLINNKCELTNPSITKKICLQSKSTVKKVFGDDMYNQVEQYMTQSSDIPSEDDETDDETEGMERGLVN